ncbi:long-chain fatty acid--CoA ligase, partial [Candidatus Parcubacteria bacterium]
YQELDNYRLQLTHFALQNKWQRGQRLAVLFDNSPEWIVADLMAATIGLVIVPIHTTFNSDYVKKVIEHSEARYLLIAREYFDKHSEIIKNLNLETIVVWGDSSDLTDKRVEPWPKFAEDFSGEEVEVDISEHSLHTIIYTSGTTGDPKGVMLSHKNLVADVESAKRSIDIFPQDRFFSFLPLSHAFERTAGYYAAIFTGSSIFFAQSAKTLVADIKLAQPTILNSVPRIFEKIYGSIFDKVESGSHFKKQMFFKGLQLAVAKRKKELKWHRWLEWKFLDIVVLKKIRNIFGGQLRLAISGGASLDLKVIKFFDNLGIKVIEGYGMTEASPIICVNQINDFRFGTVGQALDCNEVKVAENKEILVRGENVMLGYYKNQDLTNEIIDKDAWLHTGDLGFMDREGFLTIVGRAKDIIVLSTGKNIFPEGIENVLNESRYISQSMIYGDKQKNLSALVVPNFEQLKAWCEKHGIKYDLSDERILNFYRDKIDGRLKNFAKIEQIGDFKLLEEEFSQENGFLTPTLKLKRYKILSKYDLR